VPAKSRPQPLDPGVWLVDEKNVRTSHAQTFKTRKPSAPTYGA
jgi:hypothetical protein